MTRRRKNGVVQNCKDVAHSHFSLESRNGEKQKNRIIVLYLGTFYRFGGRNFQLREKRLVIIS